MIRIKNEGVTLLAEKIGKDKKGQAMMWVIVVIGIAIAIIMLFFLLEWKPKSEEGREFGPEAYLGQCVADGVDEVVNKILPVGGLLNNKDNVLYNGINVSYVCKNTGNYHPCINQHPMLLNEISMEIKSYVLPKIEKCYSEFKSIVEERKGSVNLSRIDTNVGLAPGKIFIAVSGRIDVVDGVKKSFDKFKFEIENPIYDLARVAMDIADNEAKYCYFSTDGYILLYPKFDIRKTILDDGTKIYLIEDKKTNKKMNIAVRSCAIPAGI